MKTESTSHHFFASIVQSASGGLVLRAINTAIGFVITIVLARGLGANNYGQYAFALAWMNVLAVPAIFGMNSLLVREISSSQIKQDWPLIRGLIGRAIQFVLATSIAIMLVAGSIFWLIFDQLGSQMFLTAIVALAIIPISTFTTLIKSILQGFRHIIVAEIPALLIFSILFLSILLLVQFFLRIQITAIDAVLINFFSAVLSLVAAVLVLARLIPTDVKIAKPRFKTKSWLKSCFPLALLAALFVINSQADIIMLGILSGSQETGIYRIAVSGAALLGFFSQVINGAFAPIISQLHTQKKHRQLQETVTKCSRLLAFSTLLAAGILVSLGMYYLSLFGAEYYNGYGSLVILSAAQVVSAMAGAVGVLLIMTRNEKYAMIGTGVAALLNISLNYVMIPLYGIHGAAFATFISVTTWNAILIFYAWKLLNIFTPAIRLPDYAR